MSDHFQQFFLAAIGPDFDCPVLEARFKVADRAELHALLGTCAYDDLDLKRNYSLEPDDLDRITRRFGISFDPQGRDVLLSPWHSLRKVSYLVHTNYELLLLLGGSKQFASELELYPPHTR